jgi:hypothetical protein
MQHPRHLCWECSKPLAEPDLSPGPLSFCSFKCEFTHTFHQNPLGYILGSIVLLAMLVKAACVLCGVPN